MSAISSDCGLLFVSGSQSSGSEESIYLQFTEGGFLCAGSENNQNSCGIQITHSEKFDWPALLNLLNRCAETLQTTLPKIKWKLIASTAISKKVSELFKQQKIHLDKQIVRQGFVELWFWPHTGKLIASKSPEKARVLIVDDSKTIRNLLASILKEDPEIEVVALADRPSQVEELIKLHRPNVITMDINMPEMDGVTLFKQLFPRYKIPTIMISSLAPEEGPEVLSALEAGAFDYINKSDLNEHKEVALVIKEKIKAAANTKAQTLAVSKHTQPARLTLQGEIDMSRIIAIGSSTGGTEALRTVLTQLPKNIPPILITQHIPAVFSAAFAKRLNDLCPFEVREAKDGDELMPSLVLIAPGGFQMSLQKEAGGRFCVRVKDEPPVNRHKPSVDVLFDSVARVAGPRTVGIILTGMGADGAQGMLKLKNAGAQTLAQDEKSCVVFGMPKQAIALGGVQKIVSLDKIAAELLNCLQVKKAS